MSYSYVVLIGNAIDGITDVIGDFGSEYEADQWILMRRESGFVGEGEVAKVREIMRPF